MININNGNIHIKHIYNLINKEILNLNTTLIIINKYIIQKDKVL